MTIDGPRLAAKSGTPKQLVVFLHGYGADGNDLIEIGRQWQAWLPDAAFVSPHAPEAGPMGGGRQWFALTMRDPSERWRGVNHAGPGLDAFLDAELGNLGLDDTKLALVGFSQGTMMALHVGLRRKRGLGCILGYSGVLVGPEHLKTEREGLGAAPPILLVHGDEDQVIPVEAMFMSAESLAGQEIPVQWHMSTGIGHGIDGGGLTHGGLFLAQSFGLKLPR
jgi:phospholipase/carboxylesterase